MRALLYFFLLIGFVLAPVLTGAESFASRPFLPSARGFVVFSGLSAPWSSPAPLRSGMFSVSGQTRSSASEQPELSVLAHIV